MTNKPDMLLWLSDARGQYIPRDFAQSFVDRDTNVTGVTPEQWAILEAGPDSEKNEWYWDTWATVEQNAIITDENSHKYHVHQDGDCWLVPVDMQWNDEIMSFEYPSEEEESEENGE